MPSARHVIRFAEFVVDLRSRELHRAGARVALQDQPFRVLTMLLEDPGDLVTRDELRRRLWPDGTFVDFDHSLNAAIKRLRLALGDDASAPRYVETLPRRGYRFIAAATAESGETAHPDLARTPTRRLAVLPLVNLSSALFDALAAGLTEDVIAAVGERCSGYVGVLGRTSPWVLRETPRTAAIGEALRVDYLVEGSVRCDGSRIRIAARLVETAGETQVWAASYERPLDDYLTVQAETAFAIAMAISQKLCDRQAATENVQTGSIVPAVPSPRQVARVTNEVRVSLRPTAVTSGCR